MKATTLVRKPPREKKTRTRARSFASIVRVLRRELPALSKQYKIQSFGVFGSFARQEQKPSSDLDVLVEYAEPPSLASRMALEEELALLVGTKVDSHQPQYLKPYIGKNVMRQVIWLQKDGVARRVSSTQRTRNGKNNGGNMEPKREYLDFIQDMLNAMGRAQRYVQGITLEQLLENREKLDAVSYALQTVGEAANRIPSDVHVRYPDIPWRKIIAMRNWIAHGYDVIEYNEFWTTLTVSIPRDEPLVRAMLDAEKERRKIEE